MCDSVFNFRVNVNVDFFLQLQHYPSFSSDSERFIWVLRSRYRLCSMVEDARVNEWQNQRTLMSSKHITVKVKSSFYTFISIHQMHLAKRMIASVHSGHQYYRNLVSGILIDS